MRSAVADGSGGERTERTEGDSEVLENSKSLASRYATLLPSEEQRMTCLPRGERGNLEK